HRVVPGQIEVRAVRDRHVQRLVHRHGGAGRGGESVVVRVSGERRHEGGAGVGPGRPVRRVEHLDAEAVHIASIPVLLDVVGDLQSGQARAGVVQQLRVEVAAGGGGAGGDPADGAVGAAGGGGAGSEVVD